MSQKRQSTCWEPPTKRHHLENGVSRPRKKEHHQPISTPELPPIAAQYESPVFTHQSALRPPDNNNDSKSYERLEFLGDAYIEVFASRLIWQKFPLLPVGKMSQLRENLVKNETLAQLSSLYGLDKKLRAPSSLELGPKGWTKVKGDMFEAYVAAVVLSDPVNGFEMAEKWLVELWGPFLSEEQSVPDMQAKVQLSGKIGGKGVKIDYVDDKAPVFLKGNQVYSMGVYLTGWGWDNQHLGSGKGTSKNAAGNDAAARALQNVTLLDEIVTAKKAALASRRASEQKEDNGS
jgi:ribonuclease III